jgi:uncharacterized protein
MKNVRVKFLIFFVFMLSISCTFDKMFLHPTPIDRGVNQIIVSNAITGEDIIIKLDADFNPEFYDNKKNVLFSEVKTESVFFKKSGNNVLHAWHFKPDKPNGINLLFLHGNAGNVSNHFQIVMPLAMLGFTVFLPDYSGFGLSEGKAGRKQVIDDANSALYYMINNLQIKPNNLYIYGQSLGGNLSAHIARLNKNKIGGLIIEGAFNSHKDIAAHATGLGFIARLLTKELYSSEQDIKEVDCPVLIIHSVQDAVIPFFMGKRIFQAANEPKDFFKIDQKHIYGPIYYSETISEKILVMNKQD